MNIREEPYLKSRALNELILDAVELLHYCAGDNEENKVIAKLQDYSGLKAVSKEESKDVRNMPFRKVVELAVEKVTPPYSEEGKRSVIGSTLGTWVGNFYVKRGRPENEHRDRNTLTAGDFITNDLENDDDGVFAGGPYFDEGVAYYAMRRRQQKLVGHVYDTLIEIGAIVPYPENYESRAAKLLRKNRRDRNIPKGPCGGTSKE